MATQRLDEFQSYMVLPLQTRGPGTDTEQLQIKGNSLLSTLFIHDMDPGAWVKVNYWQQTTSGQGERADLKGHALKSYPQALTTDIQIITKIHDKPNVEYVVGGGNVTFSVYVTVVSAFPNDDGAALIGNGQTESADDRGTPLAVLDPTTGAYQFASGINGVLNVAIDNAISTTDLIVTARQYGTTPDIGLMPGATYQLINFTASAAVKVPNIVVGGGSRGYFEATLNGQVWGVARCTYLDPQVSMQIGTLILNAGDNLTISVTSLSESGEAASFFAISYNGT